MKLTKTVEQADYNSFSQYFGYLKEAESIFQKLGMKIDIGHEHRFWEYGMGLFAFRYWWIKRGKYIPKAEVNICDVGAGDSLLIPTISSKIFIIHDNSIKLTEIEPRSECATNRSKINDWLAINGHLDFCWKNHGLIKNSSSEDVVFCISVIEHVKYDEEFLMNLADMVRPNGLLFLTTDVVPEKGKPYTFDNLREHNYDMKDIAQMLELLKLKGFKPFGEVDLEYKGNMVHDYSFASICAVK